MKIAVVWNHPSRLLDCSFRFEQYVQGFRELGHQVALVCHEGCEEGFPVTAQTRPEPSFRDPTMWREIGADVGVIVSWHRMSAELEAMKAAGMRVISISDSDGQIGVRVHPRTIFERMWVYQSGWRDKARCLRFFLSKYFVHGAAEDREHLASTRNSDLLVLGSSQGRRHFRRFLESYGEQHLDARITAIPFNIGAAFLSCELPESKVDRIAAVGRWGDPQKNAGLMVDTLERFCARRPSTEVVLFGADGEGWFRPLEDRFSVRYRGEVEQAELARSLATCRSIVFSSRWEGSPHAANEALAVGATLLGTPIPSLSSWSEDERFGRVATQPTSKSLAAAMVTEMEAWDRGDRDASEIAATWRQRLEPANICRQLLDALDAAAPRR